MKSYFAAIFLLLAGVFPILAEEAPRPPPACSPVENIIARVKESDGAFHNLRIVPENQRQVAVDIFNKHSDIADDWGLVILLDYAADSGMILVGNNGKICAYIVVPSGVWHQVVNFIEGTPA